MKLCYTHLDQRNDHHNPDPYQAKACPIGLYTCSQCRYCYQYPSCYRPPIVVTRPNSIQSGDLQMVFYAMSSPSSPPLALARKLQNHAAHVEVWCHRPCSHAPMCCIGGSTTRAKYCTSYCYHPIDFTPRKKPPTGDI